MTESHRGEARALVLLAPQFERDYPELVALPPGPDWQPMPTVGGARFWVGADSRWSCGGDVMHLLRTLLDEPRVAKLRATWLASDADMQTHLQSLIYAPPLLDLMALEPSPLRAILRHRRLETWFQPIFLSDGLDLWGYECLMRGRDEHGELIMPGQLLQWAHNEQLSGSLDRLARETHLYNAGRFALPSEAHILLNFLPSTLSVASHCLDTTMRLADQAGISPQRIIFEVVESERVLDRAHLATLLGHYREYGFRVGLDDVGNGHASLILLADLDPDLIKIDRYLVQRAPASPRHRSICASLTALGHEQGKLVLAEGVETSEEKAVMDHLGVDLYQGYLFARPSPRPLVLPLGHAALARTG